MYTGSSLTPLTPIPISDVNKSSASTAAAMLQGPTISVLGEHNAQFQSGTKLIFLQKCLFATIMFRNYNCLRQIIHQCFLF